jgi:hypothetical protein
MLDVQRTRRGRKGRRDRKDDKDDKVPKDFKDFKDGKDGKDGRDGKGHLLRTNTYTSQKIQIHNHKKNTDKNHKKVQIHSIDADGGDLFIRTDA